LIYTDPTGRESTEDWLKPFRGTVLDTGDDVELALNAIPFLENQYQQRCIVMCHTGVDPGFKRPMTPREQLGLELTTALVTLLLPGPGEFNAAKTGFRGATGAFKPGFQAAEGGLGIFAERSVVVTQKGLDLVRSHLAQFGDVPTNTAMLARLEAAMKSGQRITGADAIFYTHEAAEATMMARGLLYDAAHAAALAKYRVSPFSVYHPEVITSMPEYFNSRWYMFWGIK
jgi:hypothetical protein